MDLLNKIIYLFIYLFISQRLKINTCHFPNCQKMFKQYKTTVVGMSDTLNSSSNYLQTDCGLR